MNELKIPQHTATRIERRWAERFARERMVRRVQHSIDVTYDRQNRPVAVLRRRSALKAFAS